MLNAFCRQVEDAKAILTKFRMRPDNRVLPAWHTEQFGVPASDAAHQMSVAFVDPEAVGLAGTCIVFDTRCTPSFICVWAEYQVRCRPASIVLRRTRHGRASHTESSCVW
jgi:hypothetical protein